MGEAVCRDPAWLDVSVNYTIDAFLAARTLRMWPSVLRPLVHWFMPSCQKLRQHFAVARAIVAQEIENRTLAKQGQLASESVPRRADALDWLDELSTAYGSVSDRPREQVGLALAAIHTTSNLLTNVVYDLAAYPEYIEPLREEIKAVLAEDGSLKKTSLLKLKLMDSVIKESQRINPVSIGAFPPILTRIRFPFRVPMLCQCIISIYPLPFTHSIHEPRRPGPNPPLRRHHNPARRHHRRVRTHQRRRLRLPQRLHLRRLPLLQKATGTGP